MKCLVPMLAAALTVSARAETPGGKGVSPPITPESVRDSAIQAGDYLVRALGEQGRFAYQVDPMQADEDDEAYNLLRHAGATYSLCQLYQATGDERYREAASRAASWLTGHVEEISLDGRRVKVLVSDAAESGQDSKLGRTVKTGGVALGMVAMQSVDDISGTAVYRDQVTGLGDYLLAIQQPSGNVRSKFYLDRGGFSTWASSYYPGEALVALAMVERRYPTPARRLAMARLLLYLAGGWERANSFDGDGLRDFDHWSLLGYEAAVPLLDDALLAEAAPGDPPWTRQRLLVAATLYCREELTRQFTGGVWWQEGDWSGGDGRPTPGATRMEGIQAVRRLLRAAGEPTPDWELPLQRGLAMLRRCQYTARESAALPASMDVTGAVRECIVVRRGRGAEIRIDYSQHAISAWLGYEPGGTSAVAGGAP